MRARPRPVACRRPAARIAFLLASLCLPALLPALAAAAGAWQTHIRVKDYADLLVTDDAVWCATAGAGLLRFDRAERTFKAIAREPGSIASNDLTSLALDRVGRLWVGTFASGASRLTADGSAWELVNAFDGLPVDSVTTMTVAGDTLWIGTRGGIALWDGRQVLGSLPDGNTVSFDTTFSTPAITGVAQLGDTLWLSTPRGVGFARTTTNLSDWRKANDGLPTLSVDRLASDGVSLYALADRDLYRWAPDSLKWLAIGFIGNVWNLEDDGGVVLASTDVGIWRHTAASPLFTQIADSPLAGAGTGDDIEAALDPAGVTHYAAGAAGLWEQPAGGGAWTLRTPPGPPGNSYANIVIDGGRVYAATRNEGIGRWDGASWTAWLPVFCGGACPTSFRFPSEVFAMVANRDGQKWVACWRFAMDRFTDATDPGSFEHLWTATGDDTRHTLAFGAALDSSGGAGGTWFGMDTDNLGTVFPLGLDHYDSTGAHVGSWSPGSPAGSLVRGGKIRAVTVDETGRVWVGYAGAANSGVDHFVRRPELGYDFRTVTGTTTMDVWAIVAHGDSVWVLTDRDLRRISRASVPPRLVALSYETPAGRPLGMRLMDVAPNGEVYVGSEEGVRRFRADGATEDFTTANSPLASNDVRAIAVDRVTGAVWFGTAAGLNRFDPGYTPPVLPPGADDTLRVFPNPATLTGRGIQLRLKGTSAGYSGGIYDVRGRLVRRFTTTAAGQVFWDGRNADGGLVRPGVYFVHADRDGRRARARFVLLN
jgi:ligand-binding sensor domain-containing protein